MNSLNHEILDGVLLIKPSRRIDSTSAKTFEDDASVLLEAGPKKIIIDASDLEYISSAGLRVILTTAKKAKIAGGGLTIACANNWVKEILAISGFDNLFGLHENVAQAIEALA